MRWLTAGESHGRALVGHPRGGPGRSGGHERPRRRAARPSAPRRRSWRADEVREGRGGAHRGSAARPDARWPGRDPRRQHRMAEVGRGDGARPARRGDRRPRRRTRPATRRSPGRDPGMPTSPACRSTASTRPGRSSSAPARARPPPGWRSARWPRTTCGQVAGVVDPQPCRRTRHGRGRAGRGGTDARRSRRDRRRPHPLLRSRRGRADGRRGRRPPAGRATRSAAWSRSWPTGCRSGLGSYVHGDRKLDSRIAGALMGIQAIKGVEFGDGFDLARTRGSKAQDEIVDVDGRLTRTSGRSGGVEGGMSTGEVLRVRAAMKPISTIPRALRTVDVATHEAGGRTQPALRRLCGSGGRSRRRGDGGARAGRRDGGEVRRRLRRRDHAQRGELPCRTGDSVTSQSATRRPAGRRAHRVDGRRQVERRPCAGPTGSVSTFRDTDEDIEARAGTTIADLFVSEGEPHFRELELDAVRDALAEHAGVLALGGRRADAARGRRTCWPGSASSSSTSVSRRRYAGWDSGTSRPLLLGNVRGQLRARLEERRPVYEALAWLTIAVDSPSVDEIAETIAVDARAGRGGRGDHASASRPAARTTCTSATVCCAIWSGWSSCTGRRPAGGPALPGTGRGPRAGTSPDSWSARPGCQLAEAPRR